MFKPTLTFSFSVFMFYRMSTVLKSTQHIRSLFRMLFHYFYFFDLTCKQRNVPCSSLHKHQKSVIGVELDNCYNPWMTIRRIVSLDYKYISVICPYTFNLRQHMTSVLISDLPGWRSPQDISQMVQSTTSIKQSAHGSSRASKYFYELVCLTEAAHAQTNSIMQCIFVERSVMLLLTQHHTATLFDCYI